MALASGAYRNPDEALEYAFEIIREQLNSANWMAEPREAIAAHIASGMAQAERGELMDSNAAVAKLHQRRAERQKQQG